MQACSSGWAADRDAGQGAAARLRSSRDVRQPCQDQDAAPGGAVPGDAAARLHSHRGGAASCRGADAAPDEAHPYRRTPADAA